MSEVIELKKDEPSGEFAIGDVVALKSGGVTMTVRRFSKSKGVTMVNVDWMDAADTLCAAEFDARQLTLSGGENAA